MKYLRLFKNFRIDSLCKKYRIENYTISNDGLVNVNGDVMIRRETFQKEIKKIPIRFGKVSGEFNCYGNKLTSLEGSPKEVGGKFDCCINELISLEGCPKKIGGGFNCHINKLTSLEGCPKEVGGNFKCSRNLLTSLKGCPKKIIGDFDCSKNQLTIIDYLPEFIEGHIRIDNNQIRDIRVEDINYIFHGNCSLEMNPINVLFKYWKGNLDEFITELQFEDFIRDGGRSVDVLRLEYALNGKNYNKEDVKKHYRLIDNGLSA